MQRLPNKTYINMSFVDTTSKMHTANTDNLGKSTGTNKSTSAQSVTHKAHTLLVWGATQAYAHPGMTSPWQPPDSTSKT